jgi:ribonuclease HII
MVVAGVLVHDYQISHLKSLGVKDSKALSPRRRRCLSKKIKNLVVSYTIVELSPKEIDEVVLKGRRLRKLNWLEAKAMAEVIRRLHPDVAYVDASDVLEKRFGEQIRGMLYFEVEVISEHHADINYPVVSAASILAKTYRDHVVSDLHEVYGDFGSGYSSDSQTRRFILEWFRTRGNEDLPDFVRKSWKTVGKLKAEADKLKLS